MLAGAALHLTAGFKEEGQGFGKLSPNGVGVERSRKGPPFPRCNPLPTSFVPSEVEGRLR